MAVNYRINDAVAPGTVAVLDAEDQAHFVGNRDQAQKWIQANLEYAAPTHPMPGDAVRLDGAYFGLERGSIAVVDGAHYDARDRELLITFRPSAFRQSRSVPLSIGEALEAGLSGNVIGRDVVSCSGGPCPFIRFDALEYVGMRSTRFWKWRDGRSGAGRGEDYYLDVPLWSWKGERD